MKLKYLPSALVLVLSFVSMSVFASRQVGYFETEQAIKDTVVTVLNSKDLDEQIRKEYWAVESARRDTIRKAEATYDISYGGLISKNKNDVLAFEKSATDLNTALADTVASAWETFFKAWDKLNVKYKDQIAALMVTIEQQSELKVEEDKSKKVTKLKKD